MWAPVSLLIAKEDNCGAVINSSLGPGLRALSERPPPQVGRKRHARFPRGDLAATPPNRRGGEVLLDSQTWGYTNARLRLGWFTPGYHLSPLRGCGIVRVKLIAEPDDFRGAIYYFSCPG